jgi:hypothetical protein
MRNMDKIPKIPPKYAKYSMLIDEMIKRGYQFVEYVKAIHRITFFYPKRQIYVCILYSSDVIDIDSHDHIYSILIDYAENYVEYKVEDTKIEYTIVEYGIPDDFSFTNLLNTIDTKIFNFPSFVLYKIRKLGEEAKKEKIQIR